MQIAAGRACALLKTLSHEGRLMILCELVDGELSVGTLSERLSIAQSPLSQHLARMRSEGLVTTRRDGQLVYYSLASGDARALIDCLHRLFCDRES